MAKKRRQAKKNKKRDQFAERVYNTLAEMSEHQNIQDRYQNRFYEEMSKSRKFLKVMVDDSRKYAMLRDCMMDNIAFDKETERILKPLKTYLEDSKQSMATSILLWKGELFIWMK